MDTEENDSGWRGALEKAMGVSGEGANSETGSDAGPVEAAAGTPEADGSGAESSTEVPGATDGADQPASGGARARDASGKFTKGTQAKTQAPVKGATSQAAPPVADKPTATAAPAKAEQTTTAPAPFKGPQSWKPAAREALAKAPPEVQQEVARREREIALAQQEHAPAKKFQADFNSTMSQFAPLIGQTDPLTAVRGVMNMAHQLVYGDKEQTIAHLIKTYRVDVGRLDSMLAGQAPQASQSVAVDPNQIAAQVHQQVLQRIEGQRNEAAQAKASTELETWAQDKEFLEDVREEMADLFELAARRGRNLSWDDAYSMAVAQNPELSAIMKQRQQASEVSNAQASTARVRAATSSVKSQPAGVGGKASQPNSWREALEAAAAAHSGR